MSFAVSRSLQLRLALRLAVLYVAATRAHGRGEAAQYRYETGCSNREQPPD